MILKTVLLNARVVGRLEAPRPSSRARSAAWPSSRPGLMGVVARSKGLVGLIIRGGHLLPEMPIPATTGDEKMTPWPTSLPSRFIHIPPAFPLGPSPSALHTSTFGGRRPADPLAGDGCGRAPVHGLRGGPAIGARSPAGSPDDRFGEGLFRLQYGRDLGGPPLCYAGDWPTQLPNHSPVGDTGCSARWGRTGAGGPAGERLAGPLQHDRT